MNELNEFIKISHYCGMRTDLIQASGGNTSVKFSDHEMYIKSSGVTLSEVGENYGYSVVDYKIIARFLEKISEGEETEGVEGILQKALISGMRPSIETFLHAITGKVTMHVHSISSAVLVADLRWKEIISHLLPEALLVEYGTPGIDLAREYILAYKSRELKHCPDIIFLKNHGLIVTGDTYEEVKKLSIDLEKKINEFILFESKSYYRTTELWEQIESFIPGKILYKVENKDILELYRSRESKMWEYRFCPDCLVFLGKEPFDVREGLNITNLREHISRFGAPVLLLDVDNIYIVAGNVKKAHEIEEVLYFSAQVFKCIADVNLSTLSEEEQIKLLNLESEKYRQQIRC